MDAAVLLARLTLALVFAIAGVTKLADRKGTLDSIKAFGVPQALARPGAMLLPIAELVCAAALLPSRSATWAAAGTLALLLLFIVGMALNLARGRKPDCHCFGQLHSAPIGTGAVVRNVVLAALSVLVMWQQPALADAASNDVVSGGVERIQQVGIVLAIASAALSGCAFFLIFQLLRQNGRILNRLDQLEARLGGEPATIQEGLPVDAPAPAFSLQALSGEVVALADLTNAAQPLLLVFTEPGCGACDTLLPDVAAWQRDYADRLTIGVISRGSIAENRAKSTALDSTRVLLQKDRETATAYGVPGNPSAVLIANGRIASPLAVGGPKIRALVETALAPRLKQGDPAPDKTLRSIEGHEIPLSGERARKIVLLFWDPTCTFCQQMLQDVVAWERQHPPTAPELVVISTGAADEIRGQGFQSHVVVDEGFGVGHAFGVSGTPSAVLLDEHSTLTTDVVAGRPAILKLLAPASA